jgi:excinuclease ABC subunit C
MASLLIPAIERPTSQFAGFGPSLLVQQTRRRVQTFDLPDDRMEARAMLHDHCPLTPGVYGWLDANDQICYVGKSKSLRKRLLSYFAKTHPDPKPERIRRHSKRLVWEPMADELLALIREQELICRWRPDFNKQGQPTRRQPAFVGVTAGSAANAKFARRISPGLSHAFGPIAGSGDLRAAVNALNQVFHLRDCPDKTPFSFNNQPMLFDNPESAKCIRFELGTCPGPCASLCSLSNYRSNVDQMLDFLEGRDLSVLGKLEHDMHAAAAKQSFERATVLRDYLKQLTWLGRRLEALRKSQTLLNGVLPVAATKNRTAWLVLRSGQLVGSTFEPQSPRHADAAATVLGEATVARARSPESVLDMNLQLIVMAWFRKNPDLRARLMPFEAAIERCGSLKAGAKNPPIARS